MAVHMRSLDLRKGAIAFTIRLCEKEREAVDLLVEFGVDLIEFLGPQSARILMGGHKLELDAVVLWQMKPEDFIASLAG